MIVNSESGRGAFLCSCIISIAAVAACGDNTAMTGACRSDADCPSGGACTDGQCRTIVNADLSMDDLGPAEMDLAGPPMHDSGVITGDALAALCSFNGDGVISRAEAPFLVGLSAVYAVNATGSTATVDVQMHNGAWDFSAAQSGDSKSLDELIDPTGQWWSAKFPNATYASLLSDGQTNLGVYQATSTQLLLLGIVSETSGLSQTELVYTTPIPVLEFPLSVGQKWSATSALTGQLQGLIFASQDSYQFSVDTRGKTLVPAGHFDTLRLRVDVSQAVGFVTTTHIEYLHLAECYGQIARVQSSDNETSATFTKAAEYRRLSTL